MATRVIGAPDAGAPEAPATACTGAPEAAGASCAAAGTGGAEGARAIALVPASGGGDAETPWHPEASNATRPMRLWTLAVKS